MASQFAKQCDVAKENIIICTCGSIGRNQFTLINLIRSEKVNYILGKNFKI